MASAKPRIVAILKLDNLQFNRRLRTTERRLKNFSRSAQTIGRSMTMYVSAPLVLAGAAAVKFAADFEKSMVKINTLVGIPKEFTDEWGQALRAMSTDVARGPGELARALFVVTSAGIRSAEALEIVEMAAKASVIGLGDTTSIARTVTAAMQAWSKESLSASDATDTLVATVRFGNVESEELASSMGRVMGIAAQMGVSFQEVGAFIATYTRVGVDANIATTALRATLSVFLGAGSQAKAVLQDMGMSANDLREAIDKHGLAKTLVALTEKFGSNTSALRELNPNIRSLAGMLSVAASQAEAYLDIEEQMRAGMVKTSDEFAVARTTMQAQWDSLKASVENLGIVIGDKFRPALIKAVAWVKTLTAELTHMNDETITSTLLYLALVAALGPVIALIGALAGSLLVILTVLVRLGKAVLWVGRQLFKFGGILKLVAIAALLAFGAEMLLAFDVTPMRKFMKFFGTAMRPFDEMLLELRLWVLDFKLQLHSHLLAVRVWVRDLADALGDREKSGFGPWNLIPENPVHQQLVDQTERTISALKTQKSLLEQAYNDTWELWTNPAGERVPIPEQPPFKTLFEGILETPTLPEDFEMGMPLEPPGADSFLGRFDIIKEMEEQRQKLNASIAKATQELPGLEGILGEGTPLEGTVRQLGKDFEDFFETVRREGEDAFDVTPLQKYQREVERGLIELETLFDSLQLQDSTGGVLQGIADDMGITGEVTFKKFAAAYEALAEETFKTSQKMSEDFKVPFERLSDFMVKAEEDLKDALAAGNKETLLSNEISRSGVEIEKLYEKLAATDMGVQKLMELAAALGLVDASLKSFQEHYAETLTKTEEATERLTFKIGEMLADSISEVFTGILRGTRELSDLLHAYKDIVVSIFGKMIEETIKKKLTLDKVFEKNFLEYLPSLVRRGVTNMGNLLKDFFSFALKMIKMLAGAMGLGSIDTSGMGSMDLIGGDPMMPVAARGGLTTGPTLAMIGDNPSGKEAIIPLERWDEVMGRVGRGGGDISVEIHAPSPLESQNSRRDHEGREILQFIFEGAKNAVAGDIMEGGVVGRSIQAAFSSRRTGGR